MNDPARTGTSTDKAEDDSLTNETSHAAEDNGLTLFELMGSALAAAFGVQSSKNRERDFSRGRPGQFIVIGIIFTVLFVLIMIGVVNLVLGAVAG